ncbi:MAG: dethiobiotin synthase [Alphaproteobacteria bacterium]|nr:dethiobiotin synthase [Alphaproteobacteria bacterium]
MRPFFITSSGTGVGKTHVTTTLCWQLAQAGKKVTALKPVISGFRQDDPATDSALILQSLGLTHAPQLLETISPWQFAAPLAPNMAAEREGKPAPQVDELVAFCREHAALANDVLLVEGVGGVMVPLNHQHTVLDWMAVLGWPVILVVGSYLGTISHTLTAIEVLRQRGVPLHALVVSESPMSDVPMEDTVRTFEQFISRDIPIVKLPRSSKAKPWEHMPPIRWLVEPS